VQGPVRLAAALILVVPGALGAQSDPPKRATATRIEGAGPRIDADLSDQAWTRATPISDFVTKLPVEGETPKVGTEIRLLFDRDALYVGARMFRPDPENIPTTVTRRDGTSNAEELVLTFDTYLDRRTGYSFSISSGGGRSDYYHGQDSQTDRQYEFDPVWTGKARVDSLGWVAEARIPFSQLRFGARDQAWGFQIQRRIPDLDADIYWVLIPRSKDQSGFVSFFGLLEGIRGINTARGIELVPYAAADVTREGARDPRDPFGRDLVGRAGLDLKAGLGNNLTLDATINPDFGQVEADPAEVNLTQFETVFEEKRPFFTEGNEILTGRAQSFLGRPTYFYTRRIGASPRGGVAGDFVDQPRNTTILGAAKVTGRLPSRLSVGVLASITGREYGRGFDSTAGEFSRAAVEPASGFGVVRLQQEVGRSQSTVGMVLTGVHRGFGGVDALERLLVRDAVSGGVDWRARIENGKYEVTGWAGFSHLGGDPAAIDRVQRSSARYYHRPDADYLDYDPNRTSLSGFTASIRGDKNAGRYTLWGIQASVKTPGFEINDIGQMNRADAIEFNADLQLRDTEPGKLFRYFQFGHAVFGHYDFGFERQSLRLSHSTLLSFHNFWNLSFRAMHSTRAMSNSQTRGGPYMGTPSGWNYNVGLSGNPFRATTWSVGAGWANDRLGGTGYGFSVSVSTRPGPQWEASITPRLTNTTNPRQFIGALGDGPTATFGRRYLFAFVDQRTVSTQVRLNYAFTPNLTVQGYAEPFASSGRFYRFGELAQPRTHRLKEYGIAASTVLTPRGGGRYDVTDGATAFSFESPDFNVFSFRSNLVVRWEWLPGSTLFAIWQQNRGAALLTGTRVGIGSLWDAVEAPGDNFFALKASYWLKAR